MGTVHLRLLALLDASWCFREPLNPLVLFILIVIVVTGGEALFENCIEFSLDIVRIRVVLVVDNTSLDRPGPDLILIFLILVVFGAFFIAIVRFATVEEVILGRVLGVELLVGFVVWQVVGDFVVAHCFLG
ncbi:MAG: hypothetical protein MAG471_00673 [Acidimicrobiaceae bacterium]|nr:hypothetical protein [Acidimicrobiaceae bacterium]